MKTSNSIQDFEFDFEQLKDKIEKNEDLLLIFLSISSFLIKLKDDHFQFHHYFHYLLELKELYLLLGEFWFFWTFGGRGSTMVVVIIKSYHLSISSLYVNGH